MRREQGAHALLAVGQRHQLDFRAGEVAVGRDEVESGDTGRNDVRGGVGQSAREM